MTRADIIQIIFGIHTKEMDTMMDLSRNKCRNCDDCADCDHDEDGTDSLCPVFWIESLVEDEWEDCVRRFTILYNTYSLARDRGYMEGEKQTVEYYNELKKRKELESEGKNDSN